MEVDVEEEEEKEKEDGLVQDNDIIFEINVFQQDNPK